MKKPKFAHDCTKCTYLGTVTIDGRTFDMYHCMQGGNDPTIIARWADDPWRYSSSETLASRSYYGCLIGDVAITPEMETLGIAYGRAKAKGLALHVT
jgi:hypothetical protein